jgi:hypothetical protein
MPTREEKIAELRRQDKIAQLRAMDAEQSGEFQDITPEDFAAQNAGRWYDRPMAAVQGAVPFADEILSAAGATFAKSRGAQGSWGDVYGELHDELGSERERFEEESPGDALGLNIAGGLGTSGLTLLKLAGKSLLKKGVALGAEGALWGAGGADRGLENRMLGAGIGALVAPATGGALKVASKLPAALSYRSVKTPLRDRPIHMATVPDEPGIQGAIGNLYRRGVGGSFMGRNQLREQDLPIIEKAQDAFERSSQKAGDVSQQVKRAAQDESDLLKGQYADQRMANQVQAANQIDEISERATLRSRQLADMPEEVAEREAANFRSRATDAALPDRVPPEDRARLMEAHPDDVSAYMQNWWKKNGFDSVKKRNWVWDKELVTDLKALLKADPSMKLELGMADESVANMVKKLTGKKMPESLTGEQLMAIRNFFAMASNNTSKAISKRSLRSVANRFDHMIKNGLKGDDLAAFENDLAKWRPTRMYADAVDMAANKKGGLFGQDEWLRTTSGQERLRGEDILQKEARAAQGVLKKAKKQKKSALNELSDTKKQQTTSVRKQQQKLSKSLGKQQAKETRAIQRAAEDSPVLKQAREAQDAAKKNMRGKEKQAIPSGTTWPSQLVSTLALGSLPAAALAPFTGGLSLAATPLIGALTARKLATPGTQKLVAGQSDWQRKLTYAIRNYQRSPTAQNERKVRRAIERVSAMNAGEQ